MSPTDAAALRPFSLKHSRVLRSADRLCSAPASWWLVLMLGLLPLAGWIWRVFQDTLGPNPAEALLHGTGRWTLNLLWLVLAVTPLRRWLGLMGPMRWRRMLGLLTFFYACLHLLAYAWLDMGLDVTAISRDLAKRPFAALGFAAWLGLVPLAATSFNAAIRTLGGRRWKALHRLVYPVALLGLSHHAWMLASKHRVPEVAIEAALLALLLVARMPRARSEKSTIRLRTGNAPPELR